MRAESLKHSLQPGVASLISRRPRPIHCLFSLALTLTQPAWARSTIVKKLYVGNLSFKATEEEVSALFVELGLQPDSLSLLRDRFTGQPRGFGFAEFNNDAQAEKAVEALNGKDFMGRALVVNEARPQREGGGHGGPGGGGSGNRGGGGGRGGRDSRGGYGGGGGRDRDR